MDTFSVEHDAAKHVMKQLGHNHVIVGYVTDKGRARKNITATSFHDVTK